MLNRLIALSVAVTLLAGCATHHDDDTHAATSETHAPAPIRHVVVHHTSSGSSTAVAAKPKPKPVTVIKRGSKLKGKLDTALDSGKNVDGDTFSLALAGGNFGAKALKGATLEGHVEGVKSAAKFGKKGVMDLVFDDVRLADGAELPITALLASPPKAAGKKLRTAALIVGAAVAGHHIGKKMGKKHGALGGAAAGAAIALSLPGGNVQIAPGTELEVKVVQDVTQ